MADFIRFTKLPVTVDSKEIFATDATYSESLPLQRINALGYKGAVAVASSGPVEGTWNINATYTMGMDGLLATFKKDWDNRFSLIFGGSTFGEAVMTSLNVSAEANGIATVSMGGNLYTSLGKENGILAGVESELDPDAYKAVGHGSKSEAELGTNTEFFNFSWAASRTLTSIYKLNSPHPIHLDFSDENITASAQGNNLQSAMTTDEKLQNTQYTDVCPNDGTLTLKVTSLCGGATRSDTFTDETWTCKGFVQDRNVEVTVNDVLRGNITLVDYYNARTD